MNEDKKVFIRYIIFKLDEFFFENRERVFLKNKYFYIFKIKRESYENRSIFI